MYISFITLEYILDYILLNQRQATWCCDTKIEMDKKKQDICMYIYIYYILVPDSNFKNIKKINMVHTSKEFLLFQMCWGSSQLVPNPTIRASPRRLWGEWFQRQQQWERGGVSGAAGHAGTARRCKCHVSKGMINWWCEVYLGSHFQGIKLDANVLGSLRDFLSKKCSGFSW